MIAIYKYIYLKLTQWDQQVMEKYRNNHVLMLLMQLDVLKDLIQVIYQSDQQQQDLNVNIHREHVLRLYQI
jgi:hypothetical protein